MSNIFNDETSKSAVQIIRETMTVSLDEGVPVVYFATNRGKGSGGQSMAVADFRDYVSTLEYFADNGIQSKSPEASSPADMVRQTISVDDGVVSFRIKSGKGVKPAKVSTEEFSEAVELLASTVEAVQQAAGKLAASPSDE